MIPLGIFEFLIVQKVDFEDIFLNDKRKFDYRFVDLTVFLIDK